MTDYKKATFKADLVAGLTVGMMLIPQGMAYAMLAGFSPVTGLYASVVPALIYALTGTSKHLVVAPSSLVSIMVAAGLSSIALPNGISYSEAGMVLALMTGTIMFILGLAHLGFLVNFVSRPLISGFTSAAAILIILSQLKYLLGIEMPGGGRLHEMAVALVPRLEATNLVTLLMGVISIFLIYIISIKQRRFPTSLVVIIGGIAATALLRLDQLGVAIVSSIPHGLPELSVPQLSMDTAIQFFPVAMTIAFVSYMEAIAIGKQVAVKQHYEVDANQELTGLGLANLGAGLFSGFPVGGGMGRTAVNLAAGAQTQVASMVSAALIALTILFFTPLFYFLPKAVLAAIIISAVVKLIDFSEAKYLYRTKRSDFTVLVFAFLATLFLGIIPGILLSMVLSIILIIRRISHPHIALMGRIKGTNVFRNLKREPRATEIDGLLIFRIDASLYFANVAYLKDNLYESILSRPEKILAVLIDASSINEIDSSALRALFEIHELLEQRGINLYFSSVKGPVRDLMNRSGFHDTLGSEHFFFGKRSAVEAISKRHGLNDLSRKKEAHKKH